MNSNTICLRIFFVLFIAVWGALLVFIYGFRVITPLAVCMMTTDIAEAQFADEFVFVEIKPDSAGQVFHSKISYAGHTGELLTTTPPAPLTVRRESDLADLKAATDEVIRKHLGQSPTAKPALPPPPTIAIRYVRSFPSLVARDIPHGSVWDYYADTWTLWEFVPFLIQTALLALVCFLLYRHLKRSRLRRQR